MLASIGVGKVEATATSAILQWIYRDGAGRVGHIWFAWGQGTKLDTNCKTWRLMADLLNDVALTLEYLSPLFGPSMFTSVACVASVMKSVVGVAGGATRAALTQHQARRNNMAGGDV